MKLSDMIDLLEKLKSQDGDIEITEISVELNESRTTTIPMKANNAIYRIAIGKIVNGEWKFDHYAGYAEHKMLRINQAGNVEQALFGNGDGVGVNIYGIVWQDVSDTHKVEWGFTWHEDKVFYENDIIARRYGNPEVVLRKIAKSNSPHCEYFCAKYISGQTISKHDIGMSVLNIYYSVIGNVNENPELLEARND